MSEGIVSLKNGGRRSDEMLDQFAVCSLEVTTQVQKQLNCLTSASIALTVQPARSHPQTVACPDGNAINFELLEKELP